jgi:hypothetical protein
MNTTLKDVAIEIFIRFYLKEKNVPYEERRKTARIKAMGYVDKKIITYDNISKKHGSLHDDQWDSVKKLISKI